MKENKWRDDASTMLKLQAASRMFKEPPVTYQEHKAGKVAVILIPGIYEHWGMLKRVADAASKRGHDIYTLPELGDNLFDIESSVRIVEKAIDKNHLLNPILICHSKGGLIGLEVIRHKKAFAMIAIATPFSGSSLAERFPNVPPISELTPRKRKTVNLVTERNSRVLSIYAKEDPLIPNGCELPGAENISVDIEGHHKILEHADVVGYTIRRLEHWEKERFK